MHTTTRAESIAARQAAFAAGDKFYYGKQCPKGHDGKRYTSRGECFTCASEYAASPEKKRYDAEYNKANRERILKRMQAYNAATSKQKIENAKKWAAENPEKRRAISKSYKARRRAKEKDGISTGELIAWEREAKKVCHWCNAKCPKSYHVDHYVPLSKGGKHEAGNLVIACRKCNLRKSAKDPYEFAASVGRLF